MLLSSGLEDGGSDDTSGSSRGHGVSDSLGANARDVSASRGRHSAG